jgi:molybdopterin converting factor small subunit
MDQGYSGQTGEGLLGAEGEREKGEGAKEEIDTLPLSLFLRDGGGIFEGPMKVAIIPGLTDLKIIIRPTQKVTRKGQPHIVMPWMWAPWPGAQERGVIETQVKGNTLRNLLLDLAKQYKEAKVDFEPINPETKDVDFDYDIFMNSQNYVGLPDGLDTAMKTGDEVLIKMNWRWDG